MKKGENRIRHIKNFFTFDFRNAINFLNLNIISYLSIEKVTKQHKFMQVRVLKLKKY